MLATVEALTRSSTLASESTGWAVWVSVRVAEERLRCKAVFPCDQEIAGLGTVVAGPELLDDRVELSFQLDHVQGLVGAAQFGFILG
jgi:hypothetical protein